MWYLHTTHSSALNPWTHLSIFSASESEAKVPHFLLPVIFLACDVKPYKRWKIQLLLIVFKCLKKDAPSYLSSQFMFTSTIHSKNTRSQSSNTLVMPPFHNKSGKRMFHFRGSAAWNNLSTDPRCNLFSMNVHTFKSQVIKWFLFVFTCSVKM